MRRFWILLTLLAAACGSSNRPETPSTGGSGGSGGSITGRERIGWDQPAADAGALAALQYAIYVDNSRNEMSDVSCSSTAGAGGFACNGRLPAMSNGPHTLEIAAFSTVDGDVVEGPRSSPLQVVVSAAISGTLGSSATDWQNGSTDPTRDGLILRIEKLAEGFDHPVDAAFAPDGRLFIADRARLRIASQGTLQSTAALSLPADDPSQRLLSIAFDPDFERTRFVFVLQAVESREGQVAYLARYREVRGILGERAVLFRFRPDTDGDVSAVMRFGPDRQLYIAVGSEASDGKLYRLNADGTMPRDQAGTTPAIAGGVAIVQGLAWDARVLMLWIVDNEQDTAHLNGVSMSAPPVRAIVRERTDLPPRAGSIVFYTADAIPELLNNALIASSDGYILRLRFDSNNTARTADAEKLLENRVGPIRVVTVAADGAIYFCTDTTLGRLSAAR